MSLDVSLISKDAVVAHKSSGIWVRENGETKEISLQEWNAKHPDRAPFTFIPENESMTTHEVYSANITHNLGAMADEAGIYYHLWRPDEISITKAKELIDPLREGLHKLKLEPEKYKKLNPDNGWGSYDGLVKFVQNYLNACYEFPDATVEVDR